MYSIVVSNMTIELEVFLMMIVMMVNDCNDGSFVVDSRFVYQTTPEGAPRRSLNGLVTRRNGD